ncbi:hypothetical protein EFB08_12600 [Rufibacter latericius]|uniref:Uncharacterized protein n=1 Tax=Rufibacter latericius TaxID=2487040 RepID=A0A3M9MJH7_9BACT|nr:hypothetical protein EFB08_12600 [Rufibacter latericius]
MFVLRLKLEKQALKAGHITASEDRSSIKNKAKLPFFQEQEALFNCFTFAETPAENFLNSG